MSGPTQPVTAAEVADLLTQARSLTEARPTADPAQRAAYLKAKADLLTRIAEQRADDDRPCHLGAHARHVAAHARIAAAHAATLAEQARTNPKDT
jgi:hypothetical protein